MISASLLAAQHSEKTDQPDSSPSNTIKEFYDYDIFWRFLLNNYLTQLFNADDSNGSDKDNVEKIFSAAREHHIPLYLLCQNLTTLSRFYPMDNYTNHEIFSPFNGDRQKEGAKLKIEREKLTPARTTPTQSGLALSLSVKQNGTPSISGIAADLQTTPGTPSLKSVNSASSTNSITGSRRSATSIPLPPTPALNNLKDELNSADKAKKLLQRVVASSPTLPISQNHLLLTEPNTARSTARSIFDRPNTFEDDALFPLEELSGKTPPILRNGLSHRKVVPDNNHAAPPIPSSNNKSDVTKTPAHPDNTDIIASQISIDKTAMPLGTLLLPDPLIEKKLMALKRSVASNNTLAALLLVLSGTRDAPSEFNGIDLIPDPTALEIAAYRGYYHILLFLTKMPMHSNYLESALKLAVAAGHIECIEILLNPVLAISFDTKVDLYLDLINNVYQNPKLNKFIAILLDKHVDLHKALLNQKMLVDQKALCEKKALLYRKAQREIKTALDRKSSLDKQHCFEIKALLDQTNLLDKNGPPDSNTLNELNKLLDQKTVQNLETQINITELLEINADSINKLATVSVQEKPEQKYDIVMLATDLDFSSCLSKERLADIDPVTIDRLVIIAAKNSCDDCLSVLLEKQITPQTKLLVLSILLKSLAETLSNNDADDHLIMQLAANSNVRLILSQLTDNEQRMAFITAALKGDSLTVQLLFDSTAIDTPSKIKAFEAAHQRNNIDCLVALLDVNINIDLKKSAIKKIISAANPNQLKKLITYALTQKMILAFMLKERLISPKAEGVLHNVLKNRNWECFLLLLEHGFDINQLSSKPYKNGLKSTGTVLMVAAYCGYYDYLEILLNNAFSKQYQQCPDLIKQLPHNCHFEFKHADDPSITELSEDQSQSDPLFDITFSGYSVFHFAALYHPCMQVLLNTRLFQKEMLCLVTGDGETPLHTAAMFNKSNSIKLMLDKGALSTTKHIKDICNIMGETPLVTAIRCNGREAYDQIRTT